MAACSNGLAPVNLLRHHHQHPPPWFLSSSKQFMVVHSSFSQKGRSSVTNRSSRPLGLVWNASNSIICTYDTKKSTFNYVGREVVIRITTTVMVGVAVLSSLCFIKDPAYALDEQSPSVLFQHSCAGCHMGGGNILQPGATLATKDLERNGLITVNDILDIIYSGKGRMPGFGEKCAPRGQCTFGPRLSDEDIRTLAEFVRLQADQGWPKAEPG